MANHNQGVLLLVEVPRNNDKKELAAEQMFAALHGILKPRRRFSDYSDQEYISFEIATIAQRIHFYIWAPGHLRQFIESQVYAHYSNAQIFALEADYAQRPLTQPVVYSTELVLNTHESIPIKTFANFEVDPLAGITATLAKLEAAQEEMWIQILARPVPDDWHQVGAKYVKRIESGSSSISLGSLITAAFQSPEAKEVTLSERDKSQIEAIRQKNVKLGYQVKIRLIYLGQDITNARLKMQTLVGSFKQFNTTDLNGFKARPDSTSREVVGNYARRDFNDAGFILNIEELASVFHLPHTSVDTPNIIWASAKTAEPPSNLPTGRNYPPEELSLFANTNFRNTNAIFGSLRSDRGRHIYIIGQTGTGKSGLLELLALSDLYYNQGYAIVDPHGDFAVNNLQYIPSHKVKDVVYFNPADAQFPIGFNPLEVVDSRQKVQTSSELVGVMKRMFGHSWGPRLEYILRYSILALLDTPDSTMLDITRMLTDKNFRKRIVANVEDTVVRTFWLNEFASWDNRLQSEAISPVLNKVGAFIANPMVRNIVGQPKSGFNIREIMDEGKILILNLSRGLIGEDNANILGAMLITKIQLAAMGRADVAEISQRRPFYLYVDEFQNFATDSFAVILSEARKYGLHLTMANQYISQMAEEVRDAVFGNVGSIISFRVSPDDAPFLEKYFLPQFETADIIKLANRDFVTTMTIKGEKVPSFSGRTLDFPDKPVSQVEQIITHSRQKYATPKAEVERLVNPPAPNPPGQPAKKERKPDSLAVSALKKALGDSGNPPARGGHQKPGGKPRPGHKKHFQLPAKPGQRPKSPQPGPPPKPTPAQPPVKTPPKQTSGGADGGLGAA